jgi:hypothetical protein
MKLYVGKIITIAGVKYVIRRINRRTVTIDSRDWVGSYRVDKKLILQIS